MYYIRYVDPLTGTTFDYQSVSLDDAAKAVAKARDEIYFKGLAAQQSDESIKAEEQKEAEPKQEEKPAVPAVGLGDYEYYYENPYGVWF